MNNTKSPQNTACPHGPRKKNRDRGGSHSLPSSCRHMVVPAHDAPRRWIRRRSRAISPKAPPPLPLVRTAGTTTALGQHDGPLCRRCRR